MSQHGFTDLSASQRNGGDLTNILEAIQSGHIGTTRPTYAVAGTEWCKDIPASNLIEVYRFDGTNDVLIGTVDTATGEFTAAGAIGVWSPLVEVDFAGEATFDFTDFDDTKYRNYRIVLTNVVPSDDNAFFHGRFSFDGGSSWEDGSSDYSTYYSVPGTTSTYLSTGLSYLRLTNFGAGSAVGERGVSGDINLLDPSVAAYKAMMQFDITSQAYNGSPYRVLGHGHSNTAGAVDGLRLYFSSGNIENGHAIVYGEIKQ